MRILIKPGVVFGELNTRLFHVALTVNMAFSEYGYVPVITSASDGKHMAGSLHYRNLAWDFRLRDIPKEVRQSLVDRVKTLLNAKADDYDVILEHSDDTEWMHIEYDPPKIKEV